jgi:hypothetical protein
MFQLSYPLHWMWIGCAVPLMATWNLREIGEFLDILHGYRVAHSLPWPPSANHHTGRSRHVYHHCLQLSGEGNRSIPLWPCADLTIFDGIMTMYPPRIVNCQDRPNLSQWNALAVPEGDITTAGYDPETFCGCSGDPMMTGACGYMYPVLHQIRVSPVPR